MATLSRVTAKLFGGNAPLGEIGQFGSAKAGSPLNTQDVATIQALPAYANGWGSAIMTSRNFPPIEEVTGVLKTLSYQNCYTLQEGVPVYDINTNYSATSIVKVVNGTNLSFYVSLQDDNLGHSLSDADWWVKASFGERNIGEVVTSAIPLTDAGLHLLDGSLLSGSGIYAAFVNYIASIYNSSLDYFCTEAQWQQSVTTYGVCGKFVYDSVNNTVRLPKYSNKIYTKTIANTTAVKGTGTSLGLVNGNSGGSFAGRYNGNGDNGSLYVVSGSYNLPLSTGNAGSYMGGVIGVTTDGTKSGLLADLSNITTTLDGYYYIVVATATKTQIQVDIDEIATDLNSKADVDLLNVPSSRGILVESSDPSILPRWYRVYSDGWCEQGGTAYIASNGASVDLSKNFSNTSYNVQCTGQIDKYAQNLYVISKTVSSFSMFTGDDSSFNAGTIDWQAKGYIG